MAKITKNSVNSYYFLIKFMKSEIFCGQKTIIFKENRITFAPIIFSSIVLNNYLHLW